MIVLTARKPSRCALCTNDIRRGDRIACINAPIARGLRRRWAHASCAR
jgi:hypothetical protein